MSINLKKQNEQNKVSLQKEEKVTHRKVSLFKEDLKESAVSNTFTPQAATEIGVDKTRKSDMASKENGQKNRSKWWFVPVAVLLLFLIIMAVVRKNAVETDTNNLTASADDSVQSENDSYAGDMSDEESLADTADVVTGKPETVQQGEDGANGKNDIEATGEEDAEITSEMIETEEGSRTDDAAIHKYELIVGDVSWSEAFADCIMRGGYLCRINSLEENEVVKKLLKEQGFRGIVYLGGMRDEEAEDYHWVDENKEFFTDIINEGEYGQFWYEGEPSYVDHVNDEEIKERYMSMLYHSKEKDWVWNDVSDDILSLSPSYFSGMLSYICEYE